MNSPLVTILLPTCNRRELLADAVRSALCQSLTDIELLVVVDGSADGTREYLASISGPRVRVHARENRGLCASLNEGIAMAAGRYVQILNDDDRLPPDSSAVMSRFLDEHPDVAAVFGENVVIDSAGMRRRRIRVTNGRRHVARMGVEWHWSKPMFRREIVEKIGGFNREYDRVEDVDFFIRLRAAAPIALLPVPVYEYRVHAGSSSVERMHAFILPALAMRLANMAAGRIGPRELTKKKVYEEYVRLPCLYRHPEIARKVIEIARERREPFAAGLERYFRFMNSPVGRLTTRIRFAARGLWRRIMRGIWDILVMFIKRKEYISFPYCP